MPETEKSNRFYDFVRNIETNISKLATLEIKTIVGDYQVDQEENIQVKKDGEFQILQTRINLIQGDMVTNISSELVTDKYAWLRDFHARKEERGHEIIDNNVKAIVSLYELYKKTKSVNLNEENIDDEDAEI
ncbi:hypothetical protein [Chondrinema litorale]|uniref:hypothetical protein n=1 Tax=Chondrinema litorale TaxID=2994555 RepID=UPI002542A5AF|nr:hypothetical protein [Chondrinema litorale]UZR92946.1 hypothetical protein OQ292_13875 [Chondrinema litorale]